ncbi:MAG: 3-isopropylmalate dehydratase small subunit [Kiritimatiellia bacterium]|nr:3-isopropylmalate dehydratase small subunit [Kiritimatiellia bacterium]
MQPFIRHRGIVAPLDRANVDTDQIIPKQFLKSIRRTGFGESLFFDWRYGPEGDPDPGFELNAPRYQGASILVTRNNFGCGSSREHAVWAVMQYGFRVVIAPARVADTGTVPAFADIFRNNAVRNGLLTVDLSEEEVETILRAIRASPGLEAEVDLDTQTVTLSGSSGQKYRFEIDPGVRQALREGLDEITETLRFETDIAAFEKMHHAQRPDIH